MGDWAHRFGASPLMRMTASWSWSAWTDRIQVRGAMLRARGRAPLRSSWLTPPGAPCRGPQTEPDEEKEPEKKRLTEITPYKWLDALARFEIVLTREGAVVDRGAAVNVLDGPLFALG